MEYARQSAGSRRYTKRKGVTVVTRSGNQTRKSTKLEIEPVSDDVTTRIDEILVDEKKNAEIVRL